MITPTSTHTPGSRLVSADDDRNMSVVQHVVTDASQYGPPYRVLASRSHDDELGVEVLGDVGDTLPRVVAVWYNNPLPRDLKLKRSKARSLGLPMQTMIHTVI